MSYRTAIRWSYDLAAANDPEGDLELPRWPATSREVVSIGAVRGRVKPLGATFVRSARSARAVRLMLLGVLLLVSTSVLAQELVLEAIEVDPAKPGPTTLCRLSVVVKNNSDKPASALGFEVELNGQSLVVYEDQLFYQLLPAGESTVVPLFNFWVSETGRPAPADGKLAVEVTLAEAQWFSVTTKTAESGEEEIWDPVGQVDGLPLQLTKKLEIR